MSDDEYQPDAEVTVQIVALASAVKATALTREPALTGQTRRPSLAIAIDLNEALAAQGWRLIHD